MAPRTGGSPWRRRECVLVDLDILCILPVVTKRSYRHALRDARAELARLFRHREQLERRIERTRRAVIALQKIDGDRAEQELMHDIGERRPGLTEAVRYVLMGASRPMDPVDVRDELESVGYDIGSSPNVLTNVHTVLRRLRDSHEAKQVGKIANSKTAKKEGYRYTDIKFWWGRYAVPKGWTIYPDKRLLKEWRERAVAESAAPLQKE